MPDQIESSGRIVRRRTVAKAMAWAAPTIAVTAAVPTAAASDVGPTPGDSCYWGAGRMNTFHFYLAQPSQVGDTITLSGPATLTTTAIESRQSCGVELEEVSRTGGDGTMTITYVITAIDSSIERPYVYIESVNSTSSLAVNVNQERAGATIGAWSFYSNSDNCKSLGWKSCV